MMRRRTATRCTSSTTAAVLLVTAMVAWFLVVVYALGVIEQHEASDAALRPAKRSSAVRVPIVPVNGGERSGGVRGVGRGAGSPGSSSQLAHQRVFLGGETKDVACESTDACDGAGGAWVELWMTSGLSAEDIGFDEKATEPRLQHVPVADEAGRVGSAVARQCPVGTVRRDEADRPFVFCISLHKSGSFRTWKPMMEELGWGVGVSKPFNIPSNNTLEALHETGCKLIKGFAENAVMATQDTPWFMYYDLLYETFPGAKFVYLRRDPDEWARAAQLFFLSIGRMPWRRYLYGNCEKSSAARCLDVLKRQYIAHQRNVFKFFERPERREQLLVLDVDGLDDAAAQRHAEFVAGGNEEIASMWTSWREPRTWPKVEELKEKFGL